MQFISKNFNDKGKIFDYINSFKEGSAERNFAETVNEMYTLQDLKDGNKSDEEKVKSLVDLYNSKGLEIPPTMVTKMTSDKDVDRLVIEDQLKDNPKNETRVETEDSKPTDPVLEAITNDSLAGTVKALGSLGLKLNNGVKVEGRAEGSIETEIESKIEEDFESRMTETVAKYNLAEKSQLKDIKEKMSKKAQEELKNYEAKKLFEKDLSDEAKSFAILEREAKYLGFEAEKGKVSVSGRTTIESHFEDGTTHRSVGDTADEAVKGAISNLASRKAEIEKNSNNQNMRRGA